MLRTVFVGLLLLTPFNISRAEDAPATPDAPLRAVCMMNAKEGWAAGDDGLILHTLDGWESWETQRTHVRASLRSLCFVDAFVGYAVGAEVLPYGRGTAGVILGTTDGGVSWKKLVHRELPGLYAVKFINADEGFVFGDTNGGYVGGMFRTENGGKSWKSCDSLEVTQGWTAGTVVHEVPVAVGPAGNVGIFEKNNVLPLPGIAPGTSCLTAITVKDHDTWVVGTHGTVLLSRKTGGKSFEPVKLPVPESVVNCLDFNTVCCLGDHVWIAGRPGSVVFHSWDQGKTWEAQRTGQPMPIHAMTFVDEKTGFACGELGTMLSTVDGGKTWKIMRRGGHRSSVLFVTSQAKQLPLGSIALVGGDQGYLSVALQAASQPGNWNRDRNRLAYATRAVGGSTSEVLPRMIVADFQEFMPVEQLVKLSDQQNLKEQFVLALRMWRPSVVVCDSPDASSPAGPLGSTVALALREACEICSKADVYPDHVTKLDLQPWQPMRLMTRRVPASTADCVLDLDLPRPVLFAAANDFANLGRPALLEKYTLGPAMEEYTLWKTWTEPADLKADMMAGLSLGHGGQARREKVETDEDRYQLLLKATEKQRNDAKPFQVKMFDAGEKKQFFANFEHSLKGLAPLTIGDRIVAQAQEFADKGEWTMARECHLMLLDLLPTHRLAPESCRFIATMMGSSEIKRRFDLGKMTHRADYLLRSLNSKPTETEETRFDRVIQGQRTVLQRRRLELRRWYGGALAAGEVYSVLNPLGYGDPDLQLCLLANQRLDGRGEQTQLWQTALQWKQPQGVWNDAVTAEQWISQRIGNAPKPIVQASRAASMPKLDGKLDDELWKKSPVHSMKKSSGDSDQNASFQMAFDDNYLYLAVQCKRMENMPVLQPVKPRKRDDDLRAFDRVSLMLDLDRDYGSYFHLEFDARGCVAEDCCGDRSWNPQWFVEVNPTAEGWTAEVAIPLVELTGNTKLENEVWAMNVTRIVPGKGVSAFSTPSAVQPLPQGMGLLTFSNVEVKADKK